VSRFLLSDVAFFLFVIIGATVGVYIGKYLKRRRFR
jgi:uncharacterized membrane protein